LGFSSLFDIIATGGPTVTEVEERENKFKSDRLTSAAPTPRNNGDDRSQHHGEEAQRAGLFWYASYSNSVRETEITDHF
jgi:hypothetical protein